MAWKFFLTHFGTFSTPYNFGNTAKLAKKALCTIAISNCVKTSLALRYFSKYSNLTSGNSFSLIHLKLFNIT